MSFVTPNRTIMAVSLAAAATMAYVHADQHWQRGQMRKNVERDIQDDRDRRIEDRARAMVAKAQREQAEAKAADAKTAGNGELIRRSM